MTPTDELELTAARGDLITALRATGHAIGARPPVPVLGGVLIEAHADGAVTVQTNGYECTIAATVDVGEARPGRVLVDHEEMLRVLTSLVKGKSKASNAVPVTLAATGDQVSISANGYTVPATAYVIGDYLNPFPVVEPGVRVDRAGFVRALRRVLPALGSGLVHPETLAAVRIVQTGSWLRIEATDRYRAGVAWLPVSDGSEGDAGLGGGVLLPGTLLGEVTRHLAGYDVAIGAGHGTVAVSSGRFEATVRTVEGAYPDLSAAVPDTAATVTVQLRSLIDAVERAKGIGAAKQDTYDTVALQLAPESLAVAPVLSDGEATAPAFPAATVGVDRPRTVGIRAPFALDGLGSIEGDTVTVHLANGHKALVLTEEGVRPGQDTADFHLLMPIRLS